MRTTAELLSLSSESLEDLYAEERPLSAPRGVYRGRVLVRLPNAGAQRLRWRASQIPLFEWAPFGVDFDQRRWFFFGPRLRLGRFDARVERSRWRATDAIALHYERSRLPHAVKDLLYDEVKPLSEELILGLGGVNADTGEGDHFFFALERIGRG